MKIKIILLLTLLLPISLSAADPPEEARPANWAQPVEMKGVPNLHKVSDVLYRSAQPTAEGMKNLKKLIYQYKFLKLELDDRKDEHSELATEFESLFSDIIPQKDFNEEEIVKEALSKENVEKQPQPEIDDKVKKIYKDVAKKLHPDKGGDENTFKELNDRYKANDLLGVVELATENNVEFDISEEDEAHLIELCRKNPKMVNYVRQIFPWDIELEIMVENYQQFNKIINEIKNEFSEKLINVESAIMSEDHIFPHKGFARVVSACFSLFTTTGNCRIRI